MVEQLLFSRMEICIQTDELIFIINLHFMVMNAVDSAKYFENEGYKKGWLE